MHSFGYRANALLTFAVTILALMCAIASLSDNLNTPSPSAQIEILNINWFQKQPHGNDEVSLTLNITADLQSLFTWNTKQLFIFVAAEYETPKNALNQVSLWDAIIPAKEFAKFSIHTSNKYRFIDQGHNLRGKEFNLTLHWHVMPKTGKMFANKIVMSGYHLPEDYRYLDYDLLAAFPPLIYLVAALLLFYVYLSGEIFVWQAVGFVGFYLFFVGIVFWTDLGLSRNEKRSEMEMSEDCEIGRVKGLEQLEKIDAFGFAQVYGKGGDDHEMYLKLASAGS